MSGSGSAWQHQGLGIGGWELKLRLRSGSEVRTHISPILSRISLVSFLTHWPPSSRCPLGRTAGLRQTLSAFPGSPMTPTLPRVPHGPKSHGRVPLYRMPLCRLSVTSPRSVL